MRMHEDYATLYVAYEILELFTIYEMYHDYKCDDYCNIPVQADGFSACLKYDFGVRSPLSKQKKRFPSKWML